MKPKEIEEIEELANELCGTYWNTRIVRMYIDGKYSNGEEYHETYMGIFEVYYNSEDRIIGWTENPMSLQFEDKEDFAGVLNHILKATERPILELKDGTMTETTEVWGKI